VNQFRFLIVTVCVVTAASLFPCTAHAGLERYGDSTSSYTPFSEYHKEDVDDDVFKASIEVSAPFVDEPITEINGLNANIDLSAPPGDLPPKATARKQGETPVADGPGGHGGPPSPGINPDVPIDGGVIFLLTIALIYGMFRYLPSSKKEWIVEGSLG
jgi:hypothetical protein